MLTNQVAPDGETPTKVIGRIPSETAPRRTPSEDAALCSSVPAFVKMTFVPAGTVIRPGVKE